MKLVSGIPLTTHPHPVSIQSFITTCSASFPFLTLVSCRHTLPHSLSFVVCLPSTAGLPNAQLPNPGLGIFPVLHSLVFSLLYLTLFSSGRAVK